MMSKNNLFYLPSIVGTLFIQMFSFSSHAQSSSPDSENTFNSNVGLYSDYIFRGLTQTNRKPALQGGMDYSHKSGFYAGVWASNISWISDASPNVSASLETDFYGGYKKTFASDWYLDVGYLRYQYFGSYPSGFVKPDTDEIYTSLGWKWISAKLSNSISNKTFGVDNSRNTYYLDVNAVIPLNEKINFLLHAGRQKYKENNSGVSNDDLYTYNDYKAEVSTNFSSGWTVGLGFTTTNAKDSGYFIANTGRNIGDDRGYVFIKRTF